MIDIHSHILPMIDDGASSVEEALEMLAMAYEDGTDAIFLTPHFATPYGFDNPNYKIKELFDDLQRIVSHEQIPIHLYLGCEYLFSSSQEFEQQKKDITLMNNTSYLLMEFYFDVEVEEIQEAIHSVKQAGFIPILAHPERYECIQQNPEFMISLTKQENIYLQMNKGSILGRYGHSCKECAHILLESHSYHFVGSDAHHYNTRTSFMGEAYDKVKAYYGREYAKEIFGMNAEKLLLKKC